MLKWFFNKPPPDPATEEALRRIKQAGLRYAGTLDLSDLKPSTLPEAVQSLERLEKLFLHGNPGLGMLDEVLGPTDAVLYGSQKRSPKPPREILDYYFATREAEGRAMREVKLLVIVRGTDRDSGCLQSLSFRKLPIVRKFSAACFQIPRQLADADRGPQTDLSKLSFVSGCSSPRVSATQFPSATDSQCFIRWGLPPRCWCALSGARGCFWRNFTRKCYRVPFLIG
jgi:hypothetical protein